MYSARAYAANWLKNMFLAVASHSDGCLDNCPICICEKKEMITSPALFKGGKVVLKI